VLNLDEREERYGGCWFFREKLEKERLEREVIAIAIAI
jgi:hypothetical protein